MMLHEIRQAVRAALAVNDRDAIVRLAGEDRRTLNVLIGASYDKDAVESWRAVRAMGAATAALMGAQYEFVREVVRRLLWSVMEESGGIGWSAPEMLGEIVAAAPERFSDITPIIASFHDELNFRAGVLYALGRVAEVAPAQVLPLKDVIIRSLSDGNPVVQAWAIEAVRNARLSEARGELGMLAASKAAVRIFRDPDFTVTDLGTLATGAAGVLARGPSD